MSTPPTPDKGPILLLSRSFSDWLGEQNCSIGLTTYQAGRLFLLGRKPDGGVRAHERMLEQCQGLWTDGQTLWTSGMHALWRFENEMPPGQANAVGVDRLPAGIVAKGAAGIHTDSLHRDGEGNDRGR